MKQTVTEDTGYGPGRARASVQKAVHRRGASGNSKPTWPALVVPVPPPNSLPVTSRHIRHTGRPGDRRAGR